jgi:hypothetical protein
MSEYSIYTIKDEDRQFSESCTVVHCVDDVEAIEAAAQWVDLHDVEVGESQPIHYAVTCIEWLNEPWAADRAKLPGPRCINSGA